MLRFITGEVREFKMMDNCFSVLPMELWELSSYEMVSALSLHYCSARSQLTLRAPVSATSVAVFSARESSTANFMTIQQAVAKNLVGQTA